MGRAEDPNTIFRGNSMASKAIDVYMKMTGPDVGRGHALGCSGTDPCVHACAHVLAGGGAGLDYVSSTIGDLVKGVILSKKSCEVHSTWPPPCAGRPHSQTHPVGVGVPAARPDAAGERGGPQEEPGVPDQHGHRLHQCHLCLGRDHALVRPHGPRMRGARDSVG
jgi:hypothetical protein